jgi:hypothetical protein
MLLSGWEGFRDFYEGIRIRALFSWGHVAFCGFVKED